MSYLKLVKYNLRDTETRLEQRNHNLEWIHESFLYIASNLYNNLSVKTRESKDIMSFKKLLGKHTF